MRHIKQIIIHCSATRPDMDIGVNEIRQWHLQRGFNDIGYHYVIRRSGLVEAGRPVEIAGAHAQGHNFASIGICLVGGNNEADFSYKQYQSLFDLVHNLINTYEGAEVIGHRDLPNVSKLCPCFDVKEFFSGDQRHVKRP